MVSLRFHCVDEIISISAVAVNKILGFLQFNIVNWLTIFNKLCYIILFFPSCQQGQNLSVSNQKLLGPAELTSKSIISMEENVKSSYMEVARAMKTISKL